jgi:hypothetical protein
VLVHKREKEDQPEKDTNFMGEEAIHLQDLWASLFNQRCHIRLAEKGLSCESVELDLCKSPPLRKPHPQEDPGPLRGGCPDAGCSWGGAVGGAAVRGSAWVGGSRASWGWR